MNDPDPGVTPKPLRILVVCTRDPGGRRSGRKAVLRTLVTCLQRLGHSVEVAVVSRGTLEPPASEMLGLPTHQIPVPGFAGIAFNALRYFSRGFLSLNECLFMSQRGAQELRRIVSERPFDLAVADMIRAAPLVSALDIPFVIDLDDRLSDRYERMVRSRGDMTALLGYYGAWLPRPVRSGSARLARLLLAREASVLRRRELDVAGRAAGVSLVASDEAEALAAEAKRRVFALPMAVDVSLSPAPVAGNPDGSMVFVGGLDYHANAEAIRWFTEAVLPRLRDLVADFCLHIIGYCPEPLRMELLRPGLSFSGYVADLETELSQHRAFLAPIRSGRGIKTKVLDAMSVGLPVVSTHNGLAGLRVTNGENCLMADSAPEFARCAAELAGDRDRASSIGNAGRSYVEASFSTDVLRARWAEMLASALGDQSRRDLALTRRSA
jgi:glycosyltransferase involved in cell wall biosynthesis